MSDARLSSSAIAIIDNPENHVSVSAISVWEIAIKSSLERKSSQADIFSGSAFLKELGLAGIAPMPIQPLHTILVEDLPLFHRDPFDRALIATAKYEDMKLLTHDKKLAEYGDFVIVV
jgi:PIN domain nuclease of toxin-antitoxin system